MTLYTSGIVCDDGHAAQQSVLSSSNPIPSFSYSNYPVDYPSIQRNAAHFVRVEIEEHPKNLERLPGRIQMKRFIPVEIFRKKGMPFQVLHFFRFYRNDRNFLRYLLDYYCQASCAEKAKTLLVFCKWYNSIPFLFSLARRKIPVPFARNFPPKISVQMVSAPDVTAFTK